MSKTHQFKSKRQVGKIVPSGSPRQNWGSLGPQSRVSSPDKIRRSGLVKPGGINGGRSAGRKRGSPGKGGHQKLGSTPSGSPRQPRGSLGPESRVSSPNRILPKRAHHTHLLEFPPGPKGSMDILRANVGGSQEAPPPPTSCSTASPAEG